MLSILTFKSESAVTKNERQKRGSGRGGDRRVGVSCTHLIRLESKVTVTTTDGTQNVYMYDLN